MPYVVIFHIDNRYWLHMTINRETKKVYPSSYSNPKQLLNAFDNFRQKLMSGNYESYASAGMGITFSRPKGVMMNDGLEIQQFVVSEELFNVSSLGMSPVTALEVRKEIFEGREVIDISTHIVQGAYRDMGYAPQDHEKQSKLWEK